jgi:hypothetical protein
MDTPKENTQAEPTPEQAATFIALLTKALEAKAEPQKAYDEVYANNFHFEPSAWDLKILCGQLEQHTGKTTVDWHTALTIPWPQAKILAYYLRSQAAWIELQNGPITIPSSVMPVEPKPPTGEFENDPLLNAFHEALKKIYAEMFGG